jgi:hypothetical protein
MSIPTICLILLYRGNLEQITDYLHKTLPIYVVVKTNKMAAGLKWAELSGDEKFNLASHGG